MKSMIRNMAAVCIGGLAVLSFSGKALGQRWTDDPQPNTTSARADWEQRVLLSGRTSTPRSSGGLTDYRFSGRQPYQPLPQTSANMVSRTAMESEIPAGGNPEVVPPGQLQTGPIAADDSYVPNAGPANGPGCASCGGPHGQGEFGGCGDCDGGPCGECCDSCDGCWHGCCRGHRGLLDGGWLNDMQLFAGAHGFKGPVDRGGDGNFGVYEGLNFGAPLGDPWGLGYQIGFSAVQSNFAGGQVLAQLPGEVAVRRAARHQYFLTAGVFQRAPCGGMQWGVVFDLQHDAYYDTNDHAADLKQIRSETSYLFSGGVNEIGYFGAYNVGNDEFTLNNVKIGLRPTDMFAAFYRRHFETGGEGRVWAGVSGHGDALIGAEFSVPLGGSWALENRINYLIPKQGNGAGGQFEEAWGLSMQLVWYPGRPASCALNSPYRPFFGVADNANFMVNASPE
jgi:hypothetical protein